MSDYLHEVAGRLLAIDTTSGHPTGPAMGYLADVLEGLGFRTALQPVTIRGVEQHNLVAWAGPATEGGLILCGHVDTVPYADQPGWTVDPLALTAKDDRVWGRGTADMKGFLAQCVAAVKAVELDRLTHPLVLAFTAEEEVGCTGAQLLAPVLDKLLDGVPVPPVCWIGEPTSWAVYQAHKGIVQAGVTVRGRGGHSSLPHRGVNAIAVAARALEVIGRYQAELQAPVESMRALFPDVPFTTLNVGTIAGGTATNMIPERCHFGLGYRPLPDGDPLAPYNELRRRLRELPLTDYGGGDHEARVELDKPRVVPPMLCAVDTPLARALEAELDEAPRGGAPYATDGGRFAELGIDVLLCGPGELSQAHQPNESVPRDAFDRGPDVILRVVRRLCCAG